MLKPFRPPSSSDVRSSKRISLSYYSNATKHWEIMWNFPFSEEAREREKKMTKRFEAENEKNFTTWNSFSPLLAALSTRHNGEKRSGWWGKHKKSIAWGEKKLRSMTSVKLAGWPCRCREKFFFLPFFSGSLLTFSIIFGPKTEALILVRAWLRRIYPHHVLPQVSLSKWADGMANRSRKLLDTPRYFRLNNAKKKRRRQEKFSFMKNRRAKLRQLHKYLMLRHRPFRPCDSRDWRRISEEEKEDVKKQQNCNRKAVELGIGLLIVVAVGSNDSYSHARFDVAAQKKLRPCV